MKYGDWKDSLPHEEGDPFNSRLEELRWDRGLKLSVAAEQIGIPRHTLRQMELRRSVRPRPEAVKAIAAFYGLSTRELLLDLKDRREPAI